LIFPTRPSTISWVDPSRISARFLDVHLGCVGTHLAGEPEVGDRLHVEGLLLGRHDALERRIADLVDAGLHGDQAGGSELHHLVGAPFDLSIDLERSVGTLHLHGGRRVRHVAETSQHRRDRGEVSVVGHHAHEHQIRALLLHDRRESLCHAERIGALGLGILDVDGPVSPHPQCGTQGLGDPIGADRYDDHLGLTGVLDAERLLECVGVVGVDLELDALLLDPRAVGADVQARILVRHLFEADDDLHAKGEPPKGEGPVRGAPRAEKAPEPYLTRISISSGEIAKSDSDSGG
jgi:hypothetical protein